MASLDEYKQESSMFGLDKALEGKTRVQARERVGKWRDGVTMLSHHINAQMDFCKELRGHETLKKMLEEDPEEQNVKRLSKFVDDMKADIRTLHNDICERMLGKPPRGATAPAPRGSSSEWQRRTMELEEQLAGFRIAEDRVAEFGPQKLVELTGIRASLVVELADFLSAKKNALDSSLGITVDIARTVDDDDPVMKASRDVRAFLRVIEAFVDMEHLIKQANLSSDSVRHSKAVAKLQEQHDTTSRELRAAKSENEALKETIEVLRVGDEAHKLRQQTLKLDETITRMRLLEKQDAALRESNAVITSRNGVLQDMVDRLSASLKQAQKQHKLDTEWYQPRVAALEASVTEATNTIQTVQMDVELLASMYKSGVDELEQMQVKVDAAHKERAVMAAKLHKEVRSVVGLRNELRRKDNIAIKLNAARLATLETYEVAKVAVAEATAAKEAALQDAAELRTELAARDARIAELEASLADSQSDTRQAIAERDEARAEARLTEEQKKEVEKELDFMTAKVVAAGLDEAGQNRYDALRKQYADAVRMHAYFEQKLERADAEHTKNRKLISTLKARLKAEGIDVDDED